MSALGKMLVFLVLVLSLVWNGLVVNNFVTRTNWQAQAKKDQDKAKEAAAAATAMKNQLEAERDGASDAQRAQAQEILRLYEQNKQLYAEREKLGEQIQKALGDAKDAGTRDTQRQAQLESLQQQVANLDAQIQDKDKKLNELVLAAAADRVSAEKAKIEARAEKQRADRYAQRLQELDNLVTGYRQRFGELSQGVADQRAPAAPEGFRGTVKRRDGDLVEFTPGLDAGLQRGTVLRIVRTTGGAKYVGKLVVNLVDPKSGAGTFLPPAGRGALRPDDYPKAGDELIPER